MANKCFICVVGGTGARIGNALLQTLFAGIDEDTAMQIEEIDILGIDADLGSNDSRELEPTAYNYMTIHECFGNNARTCGVKIRYSTWSPQLDQRQNLSGLTDNRHDSRELLDALYDLKQQEIPISSINDGGFRANPNVGACFLTACLQEEERHNSNYTDFKNRLRDACNVKGNNVRLLMVGSLFGGTGASSFVCIASDLGTANNMDNPNYICGAVMLTPYFAVRDDANHDADIMKSFYASTREALLYYQTNRDEIPFRTFYLLGCPILRKVKAVEANQQNPASLIEAEAAQACLDFFSGVKEGLIDKVFYKRKKAYITHDAFTGRNNPSAIELEETDFGRKSLTIDWLLKATRFCLNFIFILEGVIDGFDDLAAKGRKGIPNYYSEAIAPVFKSRDGLRDALWDACRRYLRWMQEMTDDASVQQKFINGVLLKEMTEAIPSSRSAALRSAAFRKMYGGYISERGNKYAKVITQKAVRHVHANNLLGRLPSGFSGSDTQEEKFARVLTTLYELV